MMKASDPFASREQPKPLAGMDLDVLKLMQAKKNEDKQPPKKDPNFKELLKKYHENTKRKKE